jgi:sulfate adenylyltransferase subunit 2
MKRVRFSTLGCYPLTAAVESAAQTVDEIIAELIASRASGRADRVIDRNQTGSTEQTKREGYF